MYFSVKILLRDTDGLIVLLCAAPWTGVDGNTILDTIFMLTAAGEVGIHWHGLGLEPNFCCWALVRDFPKLCWVVDDPLSVGICSHA